MLAVLNSELHSLLGGSVASLVFSAPCAFELFAATTSHTFYLKDVGPSGPYSQTLVTVRETPLAN